uniref:Uncharacterized protein n=1 Tax=Timema cristinae TaxID=61476 RepID=A0A7R9CF67_TIMCR|nr:unnamed protein product [Timema cristinae]
MDIDALVEILKESWKGEEERSWKRKIILSEEEKCSIYIESLSANHVTTLKGQPIGNLEKVLSHGDTFCVGERLFRWEYLTNSPFYNCPAKDIDSLTNLAKAPFYNNSTTSNKNKKGKNRQSSFQIINPNNFTDVNMKESPSKRLVAIVTPQRRSLAEDALQAFASVNRKKRTSTLENTYQEKSLLNLTPPPMELTVATVIVATTPKQNLPASTPRSRKKRFSKVSSNNEKKTSSPLLHDLKETANTVSSQEIKTFSSINSVETSKTLLSVSMKNTPLSVSKTSVLRKSHLLTPEDNSSKILAPARQKKRLSVVSSKIVKKTPSAKTSRISKGMTPSPITKASPLSVSSVLTPKESSPTVSPRASSRKKLLAVSSKGRSKNSGSKTSQFSVVKTTPSSMPHLSTTKKGSSTLTPASCKERPSFVSSKIVKSNSSSKTLRISKGKSLSPETRFTPLITPLVCTPNKSSTLSTPVSHRKNVLIVSSKKSPLSKPKIQPFVNLELQSAASNMQTPSRTKKMLTKLEASTSPVSSESGVNSQRSIVTIVPSPNEMLETSALVINSSTGKKKGSSVMKALSAVSRTRRSLLKAKTPLSEVKLRQVSSSKQGRPEGNMSLLKKLNTSRLAPKSITKNTFITGSVSRIPVPPHSALKTRSVLKLKDVGLQSAERAATRLKTMVSTKSPDKKKMAALMVCHVKSSSKQVGKNLHTAKESIVSSLEKKYFNRNLEMDIKSPPSAPLYDESSASSSGRSIVEFDSHDIVHNTLSDKRVECKQSTPVRMSASNSDLQTLDAIFLDDQDTSLILSPTKSSRTSRILTSETGHSKVSPAKTPVKKSRKSSLKSQPAESVSTEKSHVKESRKLSVKSRLSEELIVLANNLSTGSRKSLSLEVSPAKSSVNRSRKSKDSLPRKEISPIKSSIMPSESPQNNLFYEVSPAKSQNISRKLSRKKSSQNSSPFESSLVKSQNISRKSPKEEENSPTTSLDKSRTSSLTSQSFGDESLVNSPSKNKKMKKSSLKTQSYKDILPAENPIRKSIRSSSKSCISGKVSGVVKSTRKSLSELQSPKVQPGKIPLWKSARSSRIVHANDKLYPTDGLVNEESVKTLVKPHRLSAQASLGVSDILITESPIKRLRMSTRKSEALFANSPNEVRSSGVSQMGEISQANTPIDKRSQSYKEPAHISLSPEPSSCIDLPAGKLNTPLSVQSLSPMPSSILKSGKGKRRTLVSPVVRFISSIEKQDDACLESELLSIEEDEALTQSYYSPSDSIISMSSHKKKSSIAPEEPGRFGSKKRKLSWKDEVLNSSAKKTRYSIKTNESAVSPLSNSSFDFGDFKTPRISLRKIASPLSAANSSKSNNKSLILADSSDIQISSTDDGDGSQQSFNSMPSLNFSVSSFDANVTSFNFDAVKTPTVPTEVFVSSFSNSSFSSTNSVRAIRKRAPLTRYLTDLQSAEEILDTSPKNNLSNACDLSIMMGVRGIHKLIKSPSTLESPRNDLTDVRGTRNLRKVHKTPKSPLNDLTDVRGVRNLMETPKTPKPPLNNLTDVRGVRKLMKTPKTPKSPLNDLTDVRGVRKLMKTPKTPKSPLNDLTDVRGVRKLMKTPTTPKSPLNDLTDVRGVRKLMKTPKTPKSPLNDLTDVRGVRKLMKTPKTPKSPLNDLTDVRGVRKLMKTPKTPKSPLNDLTDVTGVERLMKMPHTSKSPLNDLTDAPGSKNVFQSSKSPFTSYINVERLDLLFASPSTSSIEITEQDAIDPKVAFLKKVDLVEGTGTPSPKRATRTRRVAVISEDNSDLPTPTKRSRRLAIKIEQSVVTSDIPKQRNMLVITKNVVLPTDESLPQGPEKSKPQKKGKPSRKNMPAAATKTKEEIKLELPSPVKDLIGPEVLPRRRGHLANASDSLPNESSSGTTQVPKQSKKSQRGKLRNDQESTFKHKEDTKDLPSTSAEKNGSESECVSTLYPKKDSKKLQKLKHEPKVDNSIDITEGTIIPFTETANTPPTRRGKKALGRQREIDAAVDKSENVKQPPIKTRSLRSKVSKEENSAGLHEKIEKQNKALLETKASIIETAIKSEELPGTTHGEKRRVHFVTNSSEGSLPARSTRRGRVPKQNPTDNTSSRRNSPDNSVDADTTPPKCSRRAKNSSDSEERLKEPPKPKGQLKEARNLKKTVVLERSRKKAEVIPMNEEPTNSRSRRRAAQPK